jgi:hypothetical protein
MRKKIVISLIGIISIASVYAQTGERLKVREAVKALADHYREASFLSFDIVYKYASEEKPSIYLDSMRGSYKINGSEYWYSLDSTEAMGNKDFSVILFKEDKMIYVSRPSKILPSANPLALLDSFLLKNENINVGILDLEDQQKITLEFKDERSAYKKIEYFIDKKSGLLSRMVNLVRSDQLIAPGAQTVAERGVQYVIMETVFTHYRQKNFDEKQFDSGRYFKKEAGQFVPVTPFETYSIFLGTPNL